MASSKLLQKLQNCVKTIFETRQRRKKFESMNQMEVSSKKSEKSERSKKSKDNANKASRVNGLTCLAFILEGEPELLKLMPKCTSKKCYEFHIDDFIKNLKKAESAATITLGSVQTKTGNPNNLCRKALLIINNAEMRMLTPPPTPSTAATETMTTTAVVTGEEEKIVIDNDGDNENCDLTSTVITETDDVDKLSKLSKFQKRMVQQCNKLVRELLKHEAEAFVDHLVPRPSTSKCDKRCKCHKDKSKKAVIIKPEQKKLTPDSLEKVLVDKVKIKIGLNMLGEIIEGNCTLKDLARTAKRMAKNNFLEAKELQAKLDAHTRKLQQYSLIDYAKSNNTNIARFIRGSEYEAYQIQHPEVCTPTIPSGTVDYSTIDLVNTTLLAICPRDIYQIGDLFHLVLKQEIPLMISAFCSSESSDKYQCGKYHHFDRNSGSEASTFWLSKVLRDVPLRKGWAFRSSIIQTIHASPPRSFPDGSPMSKLYDIDDEDENAGSDNDSPMEDDDDQLDKNDCCSDDPPSESDDDNDDNYSHSKMAAVAVRPTLTETKLEFENVDGQKRELRHLHFNGWVDQTPCPDEALANFLLDRIDELVGTGTVPFQIGCHYSRSRSAVILICHLLRKQIRLELAESFLPIDYVHIPSRAFPFPLPQSILKTGEVEGTRETKEELKLVETAPMKTLDEISVNIPEMIFALRKQRHQFLRRPQQLINVYSITAAFYRRLCRIRDELRQCLAFEHPNFVEYSTSTHLCALSDARKQQTMNCVLSYF